MFDSGSAPVLSTAFDLIYFLFIFFFQGSDTPTSSPLQLIFYFFLKKGPQIAGGIVSILPLPYDSRNIKRKKDLKKCFYQETFGVKRWKCRAQRQATLYHRLWYAPEKAYRCLRVWHQVGAPLVRLLFNFFQLVLRVSNDVGKWTTQNLGKQNLPFVCFGYFLSSSPGRHLPSQLFIVLFLFFNSKYSTAVIRSVFNRDHWQVPFVSFSFEILLLIAFEPTGV